MPGSDEEVRGAPAGPRGRPGMRAPFEAVIFDMDGVVTDTAAVHAEAWKRLFDEILQDPRAHAPSDVAPFDPVVDYRRYVDGRPREEGLAAFLDARGIQLPEGSPGDAAGVWSRHGMATRKNDLFLDLVASQGVRVFPGTVALLRRLRAAGTALGLVTASRNAGALLGSADLDDAFDVVVDGNVTALLGLPGKPDPATFLEAASRLGVMPRRAAVVEDAVAGVRAGCEGGFGLVVGIDRDGQREALEEAGADYVLNDVSQLDLGASRADPWMIIYEGFDPDHEGHREALTTLGNGYMATRGAASEHRDDGVHYPGTYLAGVYNRLESHVDGRTRVDEELVNAPNWLAFDLRTDDGWWSEGMLTEQREVRTLDLRRGTLNRTSRLVDDRGRALVVEQRRLVSMDRRHVAALETTVTPEGWSGQVTLRSGVDAGVVNGNAVEGRLLANRHLQTTNVERHGATMLVEVETTQSRIRIATAQRTAFDGAAPVRAVDDPDAATEAEAERYWQCYEVAVTDGQPVTITKVVAVVTSRDDAIASARDGALAELERADHEFPELERRHSLAWQRLWAHVGMHVDGDRRIQLAVNLHIFHLLQTISQHTAELDAGVPARGLHGEGYRGHVFWDELFVLPLYVLSAPSVARAMLDYRWRRLDAARFAAAQAGHDGAMFPWQSGSDGRDETPRHLWNPRSERWMPDNSWRQRHVGLAVAYNAWQYTQTAGDSRWLAERGADLILEVARFFTSLSILDEADGRYHISGVMGPDEFHDGDPDRPGEGLRDNAYTNVMTAWVCRRAVDCLELLRTHEREALAARIGLRPEERGKWLELSTRLSVPFHDGVISQFAGYADLAELDWPAYQRRYGLVERLDLILEAEGDNPNRYRLSKQADVLMLIYLLGPNELIDVLSGLGYELTTEDLLRTVDYYLTRTANGSTLSRVVNSSVLGMLDRSTAWSEFREALDADLDDTQGGTTGTGIHLGAMAGTIDILARTFTGIRVEAGRLVFRPRPPGALRGLSFELLHRRQRVAVTMNHDALVLRSPAPGAATVTVVVDGVQAELGGGQVVSFPLAY